MDKTAKALIGVSRLFTIKQLALYILLMICSLNLQAQATYPVQVYTQLTSPYTPYLPAYYSGINQKLKVTLINSDMQQPALSVYLRMKIKSSSFTIETPENVYTEQIELLAGVPMQLSLDDLAVYFKNENMRISGARNEFLRTQMLPDNFYRFNFEVYEANTHRLVSNPKLGFAQAMIASGEPPILNLPFKGTAIQESNIPSIMFSWTPRHMNSVASAYGTEYEITLVEIFDKQVAPEAAFDYARPIYTETTRATSFIHTAAQPMLIPGMRYAWRVQAVAREGIEEANVFKNNGYSPISWFDYTIDCAQVTFDKAEARGRVAFITWRASDAIDYDVEYRKKGSKKWYKGAPTDSETCPIYNLKLGDEYEYRIGVRCTMNDAFVYTEVKGFKMPEELAKSANCGILPNTNLSNQTPTRELQAKLPILVGDFPVFITKVSGSGTFSGEGYVGIPYLKNAKIAVTFKDIVVNTDNRLISGFFETKYDISKNNLLVDIDETLTGGKGVGDIRTGEEKAQYQVDYTIDSELVKVPVRVDTSEDEIKEGEDSEFTKGENERYVVTLTDDKGNKHEQVVHKFPTTIEDKSGAIYEVDKDGNIKQVSSKSDIVLNDATKYIQDPIATVVFEEIKDKTKYALDVYNDIYKKVAEFEREYVVEEGKELRASAKFMIPNSSDEIFVRLSKSEAGFDPKNVRFVTENQKEYKGTYNESEKGWSITLVASEAKDGQLLYVVYDKGDKKYGTLAVLKVLTYEPIERHVNIVPVNGFDNGFTQARVEDELNKIYGKVGVTWHVNLVDNFEYAPLANKGLQVTGSGLFATLTDDMKALNDAYTSALGESYSNNDLYLFVIKSSDGGETPEGDMPRGKQFGYLFEKSTIQTIAHELGHGAFNLEHPFSRAGRNSFEEGALKDNLMDYADGNNTRFSKLEWDAIYAPGLVIGLFGRDKDGMSVVIPNYLPQEFADSDESYTFLTPSGEYITLPKDIYNVIFHHGISSWDIDQNIVTGTLAQFSYKGFIYHYQFNKSAETFSDYVQEVDPKYEWSKYSKYVTKEPEGYILGLPTKDGYKLYKFSTQEIKKHDGLASKIVTEKDFPLDVFSSSSVLRSKKYDYNDFVKGNNQYQISDIEVEYLSKYGETSSHLVISKIAQIRSMYPTPYIEFCTQFETWESPINIMPGDWDKKVRNDQELLQKYKNNPKEFYSQMLTELKEFCTAEKIKTDKNLNELCSKFSDRYPNFHVKKATSSTASNYIVEQGELEGIKSEIVDLILGSLSLDETQGIPTEFRKKLLSILVTFDIDDNCEKAIIKLIHNVKDDEVDTVLGLLTTENLLEPKTIILNSLVSGIDDAILGLWGADNFKGFNKAIIHLVSKSPNFAKKVKDGNLFYISHGYTPAFTRVFEAGMRADDYTIGTSRMDVELTKDAKLIVEVEEVVGRRITHAEGTSSQSSIGSSLNLEVSKSIWEKKDPIILDPFDPVIFVKNNDLGMLSDWEKGDEYTLPALFLHYADTKANNETISDASMAAIDLLGLATGYGELKMGVTGIRKFWAIADMVNSGVNLAANASTLDKDPRFKPFLDFYNLGTAASNISRILTKKSIYKEINETDFSEVNIDFNSKLREFNSNEFSIESLNENELKIFQQHFNELHKNAARRGNLSEIETGSSTALAKVNRQLGRLNIELNDKLIKQLEEVGLTIEARGQTIRLLQYNSVKKTNEVVALFHDGKFTPTRWKTGRAAMNDGYSELLLDNGYVLYQKGDDVAFGLGFQKGRVLSADETNTYMQLGAEGKDYATHLFGQPFRSGTNALDMELRGGTTLYIVEEIEKGNPGQFFTDKSISTLEEVRQWLAVKEGWKSGDLVVKAYKVKKGVNFKVRAGVIGMQTDGLSKLQDFNKTGTILEGGGYQYESIQYLGEDWRKYLDKIKDFEIKIPE